MLLVIRPELAVKPIEGDEILLFGTNFFYLRGVVLRVDPVTDSYFGLGPFSPKETVENLFSCMFLGLELDLFLDGINVPVYLELLFK